MSTNLWRDKIWLTDNIFKPIGVYIDGFVIYGRPTESRLDTLLFQKIQTLFEGMWPAFESKGEDEKFSFIFDGLDGVIEENEFQRQMDSGDIMPIIAKRKIIQDFLEGSSNQIGNTGERNLFKSDNPGWEKIIIEPAGGGSRKRNTRKRNTRKRNTRKRNTRKRNTRKRNTRKRNTRKRNTRKRGVVQAQKGGAITRRRQGETDQEYAVRLVTRYGHRPYGVRRDGETAEQYIIRLRRKLRRRDWLSARARSRPVSPPVERPSEPFPGN